MRMGIVKMRKLTMDYFTYRFFHVDIRLLTILTAFFAVIFFSLQAEPESSAEDKFLGNIIREGSNIPYQFGNYWNQVTPKNHGKWRSIEFSRNNMQWSGLDRIYLYAKNNGFLFTQDALIWGKQEPDWLASLSLAEQRKEIEEWVELFGQRYPAADYIIVVNEPLREPPFYKQALGDDGKTGWDWVIWSFEKAKKYCPNSKLIINEWGILNGWTSIDDYLEIINLLRKNNLIDGIGIQGNFLEDKDISVIRFHLEKLAQTGLPLYITGYEVNLADDDKQLQVYREQFPLLWEHPNIEGITIWGDRQQTIPEKDACLIRADGMGRPALTWLREYLSKEDSRQITTKPKEVAIEKFETVSPQEAVKQMSPGWNLGNTLDAVPTEGSWDNPPAEEYIFDDIKKAGFKTVRIPVTWAYHMGHAPDYKIDPQWFDRVEEVIDWALKRDFWVIINTHHDNDWISKMAIDPETGKYVNDYENNIGKFEKLWQQIAERFKGKSEKLIFEILNEPRSDRGRPKKFAPPKNPFFPETRYDLTHEQLHDLHERVLKIIRPSGGHNSKRLVVLGGLAYASEEILEILKLEVPDDKFIILKVHYYKPWCFLSNCRGVTSWGTPGEKTEVYKTLRQIYYKFVKNKIPVIISEWGTLSKNGQLSRWYYHDYVAKRAYKYRMPCILWDNGNANQCQYYDRKNRIWRDEVLKEITVNAGSGIPNSFIFPINYYFKINAEVEEDLEISWALNGNELLAIYNGDKKLIKGMDYLYSSLEATIKKEYVAKLLETAGIGAVATLIFDFSRGVDMPLNIIRYDLPQFSRKTISVSNDATLLIPISFNGVKLDKISLLTKENKEPILRANSPYLSMDTDFDYTDTEIILKKELLQQVKEDSIFTFEFWPEEATFEVEALVQDTYLRFVFPQ